jgi:hypothetical protein
VRPWVEAPAGPFRARGGWGPESPLGASHCVVEHREQLAHGQALAHQLAKAARLAGRQLPGLSLGLGAQEAAPHLEGGPRAHSRFTHP